MSTFANRHLKDMTKEQLHQYDRFLDENDWDIFYWATQEAKATENVVQLEDKPVLDTPRPGEWAQTVGTFKAAYRPVPARWEGSEILTLLRQHVKERSKAGPTFMPNLD
jgi:hypothetical protein